MAPRVDLERAPAPVVVAGSDDGLEGLPSRSTALQVGTGRPAVSVRQGESADAAKDDDGVSTDVHDMVRQYLAATSAAATRAAAGLVLAATGYVLPEAARSRDAQRLTEECRDLLWADGRVRMERL